MRFTLDYARRNCEYTKWLQWVENPLNETCKKKLTSNCQGDRPEYSELQLLV